VDGIANDVFDGDVELSRKKDDGYGTYSIAVCIIDDPLDNDVTLLPWTRPQAVSSVNGFREAMLTRSPNADESAPLGVTGRDEMDPYDGVDDECVEEDVAGACHMSKFVRLRWESQDDSGDSIPQVAAQDEYSGHGP
jgi:hypothetical protein